MRRTQRRWKNMRKVVSVRTFSLAVESSAVCVRADMNVWLAWPRMRVCIINVYRYLQLQLSRSWAATKTLLKRHLADQLCDWSTTTDLQATRFALVQPRCRAFVNGRVAACIRGQRKDSIVYSGACLPSTALSRHTPESHYRCFQESPMSSIIADNRARIAAAV